MKKILFQVVILLVTLLRLNAQNSSEMIVDTLYHINLNYYRSIKIPPELHVVLLPKDDSILLDISNYETLMASLHGNVGPTVIFLLDLYPMIRLSYPDSSDSFVLEKYVSSMNKWADYNSDELMLSQHNYNVGTGECFVLNIAKLIAVTKRDVGKYPIAVCEIIDVIPMVIDEKYVKINTIPISKATCYPYVGLLDDESR